ncbi:MAG TPA: RecX family transcriptional regulator [Kiloniellales bacterium]
MPDDISGKTPARKPSGGAGRRRGPTVATPETLERAAYAYLARYAAPAGHLRRILLARVARSARFHGTDPAAGAVAVEAIVARLSDQGLLDDSAYALAMARRLFRRGTSRHAIRARLRAKGVEARDADAALAALQQDAADPDLAAGLAFARRKRLGPFRPEAEREARRERDLALFARQGFSLDLARRVVDARDLEDLEAEAGGVD